MSEINLPEPYGWLHDANGNDPLTFAREMKPMTALLCSTLGVYTAEQVRAAVLAERERIAAFVETGYSRQWAVPWRDDLAAAIRRGPV